MTILRRTKGRHFWQEHRGTNSQYDAGIRYEIWDFVTIILAQVHRDPLNSVKDLIKLECFSSKGFNRLKETAWKVLPPVRRDKRLPNQVRIREEQAVRYQIQDDDRGCDFSQMDMRGKRLWWKRTSWDSVVEQDNPWGDLSYEAEAALKALLKG